MNTGVMIAIVMIVCHNRSYFSVEIARELAIFTEGRNNAH